MNDATRNLIGGRYEVIAPLGKGGMGIVYKAYDPVLDRTVAIKKMAASIVDHEEFRQRFFTEARAVARLNHPNIVTIHELEEDEGGIYIVMEMLDGVPLSAVMRSEAALSRDTQVTLLAKVCSGLEYAHVRGIIHRDIKPANLMLTTTGGVKILDFGVARFAASELTSLGGNMLGTPHYMSPEQIEGIPVDARADWFSFGAVAYELIAHKKPFDAPSVPPLLLKITHEPHVPLIDVAPDTVPPLSAIVDRLLAKDRDRRTSSGADVQCALNESGDTNREDLIADVVRRVMGDLAQPTIIQPLSVRGMSPLIAARPTTPAIPSLTSTPTTPLGGGTAHDAPTLASGPSTTPIAPVPSVTVPTAPISAPPFPTAPAPTATAPAPPATAANPPATAPAASAMPAPAAPAAAAPAAAAPAAPAPAATVPAALAPAARAVSSAQPTPSAQPGSPTMTSDIPAARSSLRGALIVVALLLLVIGLSGAGAIWWWLSTDAGRSMFNALLGRKPVTTSASTSASSPSSPSSTSPSNSAETPASSTSPLPSSSPSSSSPSSSAPLPSTSTPSEPNPSSQLAQSQPTQASDSKPSDSKPTEPGAGASVSQPAQSQPQPENQTRGTARSASPQSASNPSPEPSQTTAGPSQPSTSSLSATQPRSTRPTPASTPRAEPPRHAVANAGAGPVETRPSHGSPEPPSSAAPPPPVDERPPAPGNDPRAPLDETTVNAFKSTRGSSTPSGYGVVDSPMTAASIVRIKDTLDTYCQAIEHQDLDTLRSVREPLTASESAQAQSGTPTLVRFNDVEVHTDGRTAAVRARRAVSVGGSVKSNGVVEIRLTRRPAGWIITEIR